MILQIQFSSSTAFTSQIIRRLCHSPFSHVDIILANGLLGVSGPDTSLGDLGGVRIRPDPAWPYRIKRTLTLTTPVAERIVEIAQEQINKPFDNGALYDFLSDKPGDRDWRAADAWFCSELVAYALEQAGFFPYTLVSCKNRITPADLLLILNPYLTEDDIHALKNLDTP